ncbi:DUF3078 domain-containing protein [Arenibacter sp. 6A1]|uniref:DUF3078 domain-containing protein n=1 Tax=Arenibacter sp. 6A1 TaxID=2720391 RepID=UPI001F10007E|nr:DUF3078 domain-containing protein [Arenibacter sp. 6A1]
MRSKITFIAFLILCFNHLNAQDTIPPAPVTDSLRPTPIIDSLKPAPVIDSLRPTPIVDSLRLAREIDSIRPFQYLDSMQIDSMRVVDTIVIRTFQDKIKNIPRGANLTNPVISFKRTKPLDEQYKRFRIPSFWEKENKLGINLSEVAFINWNAGGNNSVSALANIKFVRNYKFRYIKWDNDLELRYGINSQENEKLRKTDDAIRISSTFAYRRDTISNWYYSVRANFNTQFSKGFKYPNRKTPISRFMAPGYGFIGAGTSFIPEGKKLNLYISPFTQKATFILDQDLADKGAFGAKRAQYDADGNKITDGENVLMEFGFLVTNTWESKIYENAKLRSRASLYSDYLKSFGNIDIDWELNLELKVNKYVSTNLGTHILYDDDILFDPVKAEDGTIINEGVPKIQFKQLFAVGISYNF